MAKRDTADVDAAVAMGRTIRQLRIDQGLTLKALSAQVGIRSSGYLSDVEAGRKNLTAARLDLIAKRLGTTADVLKDESVSLAATQISRLVAVEKHLPRATQSPIHFISAADATARGIGLEHFFRHEARQQLQTLSDAAQEQIEKSAEAFAAEVFEKTGEARTDPDPSDALETWLATNKVAVDELERHSTLLPDVRAMLVGREQRLLLVSKHLSPARRLFVLGREIGYRLLSPPAPAQRSYLYPPDREESIEQVLFDHRVSCFAAALLVPQKGLAERLNLVLDRPTWDGTLFCGEVFDHYLDVASEETVMYRFSQVMLARGLKSHFLKIVSPAPGVFRLNKQLNLSVLSGGAAINAGEHLCNRWLATRIINQLRHLPPSDANHHRLVDAQVSQFPMDDEGKSFDEFFGISVACSSDWAARPVRNPQVGTATPDNTSSDSDASSAAVAETAPAPGDYVRPGPFVSVTVGFSRARARTLMPVASDLKMVQQRVSDSCERCGELNCQERAREDGELVTAKRLSRQREIDRLLKLE